ncbi:MAG: ABC transporter ATP-binding protein [Candidatus Omnitrophota bacterium]|nr:MAG: ABC transporter ATP-binding protein [Candidatus Omnitrophota bacterium]
MFKLHTQIARTYRRIILFKALSRIMGVTPSFFIIQVIGAFLVAFFDGMHLGLLAPLLKGIIERDFAFLHQVPVLKTIVAYFAPAFPENPNTFLFLTLVSIVFAAALLKYVIDYLLQIYSAYKKELYHFNIKQFIFERYFSFGKLYFDRSSHGYIRQVLFFLEQMLNLLEIIARTLVAIFTLLVYLVIMVAISWQLTIFALTIYPILNYAIRWIVIRIKRAAESRTNALMKLSREVFNILSCITLVKAYSKEEEARERFRKINTDLRRFQFSVDQKFKLILPLQEVIILVALLLLSAAVAFIFVKGKAGEVSGFLVFFLLARRSVPLFASLNLFKAEFAKVESPIRRILEVLDDRDKFFVPEGHKVFRGLERSIEFRGLNFAYFQNIPVLNEVNFTVEQGKMTAIVGPTGAGKTTVINLLMRFYDSPSSAIFIDNIDIREFTTKSLRAHIALVTQESLLFNDTLRNNITYGLEGRVSEDQLIDIAKKARLYDFITKLPKGFDTEIGDRGMKLSGGEKQRVAIARALLKNTEILILDEATSSMDTHTEQLIQEAIGEAVRGKTTIVIAHRLSTIKHADKIVVIENGRVVEEGSLNELLKKRGAFYEYWEMQKFY